MTLSELARINYGALDYAENTGPISSETRRHKGIEIIRNRKNKFTVLRLHYSADPARNEKWMEAIRSNYSPEQWDQEYEIDWGVYTGKRFFQGFKHELHIKEVRPIEGIPIIRGWDFGFHWPAVVFAQRVELPNEADRLVILDEYYVPDIELDDFAVEVINYSSKEYSGYIFSDFCDPAGKQVTDKGPRSSIDILNSRGIRPGFHYLRDESYGWGIIRQQLIQRRSTEVGLHIDPRCTLMVQGFGGELHFPAYREGQRTKDTPSEKHPYIDLFDALKYLCVGLFYIKEQEAKGDAYSRYKEPERTYSYMAM